MTALPLAFASPWMLLGLAALPVIWWLLRMTPPRPQPELFPPFQILRRLLKSEETPARSPWWLTLLRLVLAALLIVAMAGPLFNPAETPLDGEGHVLLAVDDGWAAAGNWDQVREQGIEIAQEAGNQGRAVILVGSTDRPSWPAAPISADEAIDFLQAAENLPIRPDHEETARRIGTIAQNTPVGDAVFLSDGLQRSGSGQLLKSLEERAPVSIYRPGSQSLLALSGIQNEPGGLRGKVNRRNLDGLLEVDILGRDQQGNVIARGKAKFESAVSQASFSIDQPVELRNQIVRLEIEGHRNPGAVQLMDEANRRRLVGVISGEKHFRSQPLLSPLNYLTKALEPFADIRLPDDSNVAIAIPELLAQRISVLILADIGNLPQEAETQLATWIANGGMLIRFAGPRLAAAEGDALLPVEVRPGDRSLGGALSWETPKPLAPFERETPFYGIELVNDVLVKQQILALQEAKLDEKTWASLNDGTPLVTAAPADKGWIVLFHVTADSTWSNLPLSGTFVEMLRRTVNLSKSRAGTTDAATGISLPPLRILDGVGRFIPPDITTNPLIQQADKQPQVSLENPPGFYGTDDAVVALNLFGSEANLTALDPSQLETAATVSEYTQTGQTDLKGWLILAAAILLMVDCIAVLWFAGALRPFARLASRGAAAGIAALITAAVTLSDPASAQQQNEIDYSSALRTRLAYVKTGISEIDTISEAGMRGLTFFLKTRTALEPGEPIGLDLESDELSFYSLIYWPVDPVVTIPDNATMARVDAYMKQGGSILFDTRDQLSGILGGTAGSPAARTLQQILAGLDIPPLEPVPPDHVLTKSFYLLDRFPGRFSGGDLWVESYQQAAAEEPRPARGGDGVSSILITSNDLAGAWAIDGEFRPLLPTVPPDPIQRNYAFRVGVNLMMYALTGNYKADQVHLPALLERLGQ